MAYNLIDERWIPVERRSGKVEMIAPAQIAERDDPPVRIASPRPDFDGALLEFLVALVQTAAAPATERAWRKEWEEPPTVVALKKRFDAVREAFYLDGDGPRFMQDLTVGRDGKRNEVPIGALLIDRIGEVGLEDSPSLFAKPGGFDALGYPAIAAALMALQTYSPAGGRGQLTSLRGGGPLTTLIAGATLRETAWLNMLPRKEFDERVPGDPSKEKLSAIFPWMVATRTSATRGGGATFPRNVHPLQCLWGLPRRFRVASEDQEVARCAVLDREGPVVRSFFSRPDGTSYEGDFRHPYSPYSKGKEAEPWNPKKASADGLPYRDWPLLVTGSAERAPATVVAYFARHRREFVEQPRLLAFGYAMDNMKPLRWSKAETPLITVAAGLADAFSADAEALVSASEEVRRTLSAQLRAAWSDRPADLEVLGRVNPAFWGETESTFFSSLQAIRAALESDDAKSGHAAREAWLGGLHRAALRLFDSFVALSAELGAPDLRRAIQAQRSLSTFTSPASPKLRRLLGLEVDEQPPASANPNGKPRKGKTK